MRLPIPADQRVIVEGVNFIKKHAKAIRDVRQAGIIEREAPVNSLERDAVVRQVQQSDPGRLSDPRGWQQGTSLPRLS